MKNLKRLSCVVLILLLASPLRADFPIVQTQFHDVFPAVAYNSTNDEYLVVWSCLVPWIDGTVFPWAGFVLGQRIGASGTLIDDPFIIIQNWCVVNVSVAYNSQANDYMVAAAYGSPPEIYLQRISNTGTAIGSAQVVLSDVQKPKILYNSLANSYLLLGSNASTGLYSRVVGTDGLPLGTTNSITGAGDYPDYAIAYAPISSTQTPYGRYLLARSQIWLSMLDSDGKPMITWFMADGTPLADWIPFPARSSQNTSSLAFGMYAGYNVFTAVWSGAGQFDNIAWPGIWTNTADADKVAYSAGASYSEYDHPVSCIYQDAFYAAHVPTWMPTVVYNPVTDKFFVAWRQTAVSGPESMVGVNHIRGEWLGRQALNPNNPNFVLSATNGSEDPNYPAAASSTKDGNVLVVWTDMRNSATNATDIYGTLFDISQTVPIQLSSFTASFTDGARVRLEWTTASETNNYGFYVQKSKENVNGYQTIENSFVSGHGTTIEPHTYLFTDVTAIQGTWWYRLKQIDLDGTIQYSEPVTTNVVTSVSTKETPSAFVLLQNYPNPFNPSTRIAYELAGNVHVKLTVMNTLGQEVATLVNGNQEAGYYAVQFDASRLSSGVYLYRIQARDFVETRKLIVVR
jgi:hypothetical protein